MTYQAIGIQWVATPTWLSQKCLPNGFRASGCPGVKCTYPSNPGIHLQALHCKYVRLQADNQSKKRGKDFDDRVKAFENILDKVFFVYPMGPQELTLDHRNFVAELEVNPRALHAGM